jgi:hypothetical protein
MKIIKDKELYNKFVKEYKDELDGVYSSCFQCDDLVDERSIIEYCEYMFKIFKMDKYIKDYFILIQEEILDRSQETKEERAKLGLKLVSEYPGKYFIEVIKHTYDEMKGEYLPKKGGSSEFFVEHYEYAEKYTYPKNDVNSEFLSKFLLSPGIKEHVPKELFINEKEINIEEFKKYFGIKEFVPGTKFELEIKELGHLYKCRLLELEAIIKYNIHYQANIFFRLVEEREELNKWTMEERGYFFTEMKGLVNPTKKRIFIPWDIIFGIGNEFSHMFVGVYNVYMNYKYNKEKYQYFFDFLAEDCTSDRLEEKSKQTFNYLTSMLKDPEFRIYTSAWSPLGGELDVFFCKETKTSNYSVDSFLKGLESPGVIGLYMQGHGKYEKIIEKEVD